MNISLSSLKHDGKRFFNVEEVGNGVFGSHLGFKNDILEFMKRRKNIEIFEDDNGKEWIDGKNLLKITKWIQKMNNTQQIIDFIKFLRKEGIYSTERKISQTVWKQIGFNQKWKCMYCKSILKPTFQLDHIIELEVGGEDTIENLQALCVECHAQKTHGMRLKKRKRHTKYETVFPEEKLVFSKYFKK